MRTETTGSETVATGDAGTTGPHAERVAWDFNA